MVFLFSAADIAFGIAVTFLFGILAASLGWSAILVFFVFFICGAIFCVRKRTVLWKEFLVFFIALVFGLIYYHAYLHWQKEKMILPFGKKVYFSAIVSDEPRSSLKYELLSVTPTSPRSHGLTVFAPAESDFHYGDLLRVDGVINESTMSGEDPVVFSPKITLLAEHQGVWLIEKLLTFKQAVLKKFEEELPEEEAQLLGGIAFGSKQNFSADLKNAMALSGTTHLVAISGYNITIVIVAIDRIFGNILSRRKTFYLITIFIVLFVLMTGVQASAIRAAIMGFIALLAREAGRVFDVRNAVALSATVMTLVDPTTLTQNAGFELSFMSLLGIVYLDAPLKKLFRLNDPGFLDWKANAITTFSAQLGVMPVLVHTFGQFSGTAIVANVLVLGTVPLTMFFGFLLAILGFLSPYIAFFVAQCAGFLLAYQLAVIRLFGALTLPLPVTFNSIFTICVYYLALGMIAFSYGRK